MLNEKVQGAGLGKLENGRCNFRQFLFYITADRDEKARIQKLPANIEDQKSIDVLADKLWRSGVKGAYYPGRIYEGVHADDIPSLFNDIAKLIGEKNNAKNSYLIRNALTARKRVQEGRVALRNRDVGYLLRWDYDRENSPVDVSPRERKPVPSELPLVTKGLVPEIENRGRGWETVDLQAAKDNILADPRYKGQHFKIQDYINEVDKIQAKGKDEVRAKRQGHKANIEAITQAKKIMSNGAECPKK
ncbi:hypothetical protein BJX76DRAFT_358030 [Aspergillus varians]